METTWEFKNVQTLYRDGEPKKWQTSVSAATLAYMFENDIIRYVGEIQRGTKITPTGEEKDVFSIKHIRDIYNAMISGQIHGGNITLNYSKDDNKEPLNFDKENNLISGQGYLQILDGQHRIRACQLWVQNFEKNPDAIPNPAHYEFAVTIEWLTNLQAKQLFSEYATTPLKISRTRVEFLLNEIDYSSMVARRIMNDSDLRGRVETVATSIPANNPNVVTFGVLSRGVRNYFKPATTEEVKEIGDWLVKYFNKLVALFPDALSGKDVHLRKEIKKKSFVNELMTFLAYINVAKELMGDNEWDKKLEKLKTTKVKVGDWTGNVLDKDNPIWKGRALKEDYKIIHGSSAESFVVNTITEFVVGKKEEPPKVDPIPPTPPNEPIAEPPKPNAEPPKPNAEPKKDEKKDNKGKK